jgi:hypothetical protein
MLGSICSLRVGAPKLATPRHLHFQSRFLHPGSILFVELILLQPSDGGVESLPSENQDR